MIKNKVSKKAPRRKNMKILFIACYSPLINNSASIETLQYLNNLAKNR